MQPIRVLVVDDEKDFASAVVERLALRGFQASAVFSGQEALKSISITEYDVIVLDLKMPGIDGLETLKAVRQIDPDLQVLVLTGHATVSAGIGGMQLGAADFLQKPVAIETLGRSIEAAAERTRSCRESKQKRTETKKEEKT
jgi:DNA-binding NtrC family response regulator